VSQNSLLAVDTVPVNDLPTAVELPRAKALHPIPPSSDHGLDAEPVDESWSTVEAQKAVSSYPVSTISVNSVQHSCLQKTSQSKQSKVSQSQSR